MRPLRLLLPLFLPPFLLPACAPADAGDGATATVDTVDGTPRLRYAANVEALDWGVDTLFVLGDAFAEDAYQFNEVSADGLAGDGADGLLVLDAQGGRVLRYDPEGRHLGTYGGKGEGPGELSQPIGLDVGPGDTIWVSDFSNSRLTGYPLEGGDVRTIGFPENAGVPSRRMAALGTGYLVQFTPLFNFRRGVSGGFQMSRGDGTEEAQPILPLVRYDRQLSPRDTLWTTPEPPRDIVQLESAGRLVVTMMSREFYPEFQWDAFQDGGLVISDSAAYVLHVLAPDGTVERIIERDPPPREVTDADRERARERVREESRNGVGVRIGGGGPDEDTRKKMLEQRLEKMTFDDRVPRVVALRVDPLDRIWVGVSEDTDELTRVDLFDRDGRLLGELRDAPMPDVFLSEDRFGVLRRDDMDVQQVVVARWRSPGRAR